MSIFRFFRPFFGYWSRRLYSYKSLCGASDIDGKSIADKVLQEIKVEVDEWVDAGGKKPKLISILVGENPSSKIYIERMIKTGKRVGIDIEILHFEADISQVDLLKNIQKLNDDPDVDGILVQFPVSKHISEREVCRAVVPSKDVDGFHPYNIGRLALNSKGMIPATALGVKELIVRSQIPTFCKNAVVIGRSKHIGLPIALLLHSDENNDFPGLDLTTTICHRYTQPAELKRYTKNADIVVSSAGVPGLVTKDMIKPGACVIDVGITRVKVDHEKFKFVGDVDYESVREVAGYITPVPGGVGPMTVAMIMKNTFNAAKKLLRLEERESEIKGRVAEINKNRVEEKENDMYTRNRTTPSTYNSRGKDLSFGNPVL
ncbi:bifunctional methylenetetrahydrofolate dehydrogenase/cyclohydrolase, mitochondrial-like [Copidosoma floridanum]|uniref:bifunctional methylenetetrahydrofolate dehydrogenase/cyclohydrolase, mitochondrial-like n=1 Tax=Copidosoma floridanum TaxID=29053 RepID=UPI0006C98E8B|nr:bifunctional methylenetetrahydrofolate dehydrogenase/cyclohydrolase, mitochondrial-like [Copidosoma floridanum]